MTMTTSYRTGNVNIAAIAILAAAALVFAYLWFSQLHKPPVVIEKLVEKPVEVVREVEVEKIREVPKEVIVTKEVEVPGRLTEAQQATIDFAARLSAAPMVSSPDELLYKLDSVKVAVFLDDSVKTVLTEERVRNKFELVLRQYGVTIDEKSPVLLAVYIEGLSDPGQTNLTWNLAVELQQVVTIERKGDFRRTNAILWREALAGDVRRRGTEPAILRAVEAKAESFANRYLATQSRSQ